MSSTREEQLRDSVGPPPDEVPRKVAVIHCDIQAEEQSNTLSFKKSLPSIGTDCLLGQRATKVTR